MKKNYQKPACNAVAMSSDELMRAPLASSIQNHRLDVTDVQTEMQHGIQENNDPDFEAGAKNDNPWGLWE